MGREQIMKKLRGFKHRVSKDFPVEKAILSGSRARGEQKRDSDIDLIIVSRKFGGLDFMERASRMYDYWEIDSPVDFLCFTPEEFRKRSRMITIVREAVREGITL